MKVLILTTSYPSKDNPTRGIFLYKLVQNLKKLNLDVNVLTLNYGSLSSGSGILPNLKSSFRSLILFPIYCVHFYLKILLNSRNCDIIHANWGPTAFFALLAKPFHGKKIILTERSSQLISIKNKFIKFLLKYTYKNVDSFITISDYSGNEIVNNYNIKKPIVIPNGVEFSKTLSKSDFFKYRRYLGIKKQDKIIIFVGRLTSIKCVDYLIKAFASIKIKNKFLIIIGDGDEYENLKNLVSFLGINKKVKFLGNIGHNKVLDYMHISDVFVLPSIMETGGNVLFEAASCGLPLVSTMVGWAKDLIRDGVNGYFINKKDTNDIVNKLNKLLINDKILLKFKNNSNEMRNTTLLSWGACAKLYEKKYKAILSQN